LVLVLLRPGLASGSIAEMVLSFAYLASSAVLKLLLGRRRSDFAKDVKLLTLRHQLLVLALNLLETSSDGVTSA
jgi:hypothetical protein